jgi:hypothetical protein
MDTDLAALLRSSLVRLLAEAGAANARDFARKLDELGWEAIPSVDQPEAVRLLFEARGEVLGSADALTPVLAARLAAVLSSDAVANCHVGLPSTLRAGPPTSRVTDAKLVIDAVTFSEPSTLVVPVEGDDGTPRIAAIGRLPEDLERHRIDGLDPDLGLWRLKGGVPLADARWFEGPDAELAWEEAVAVGRRALAAELVAIGRHLVRDAVDYARSRQQYGRPIGSFQAIQHELADAHVAVVGASNAVIEATLGESTWTARVAKALAGRAFDLAARTAQQVFGAIGFTWEHHFHRYLRRGMLLDAVLDDWCHLETEIGERLAMTRTVPRIGTLWSNDEED